MKVFGKALVGALAVALASMSHVKAQTRSDAWPDDNPKNWPMYHRDFSGSRHSPLREITTANVKDLHVAWLHQPGVVTQGLQVTPLAVDGVIYYIGSGDRVFALDGATGHEIWHYYPQLDDVANEVFFTPYSRGIALGHGRVYIGTLDGRGVALDAKTGKEVWQLQLTKPRECGGCNFTSPPVVAGDMLVFGPTGGDLPNQGKIYGVDTRSGKLAWSFETLRDAPESWGGDSRRFGGGGAWMTGSFDPATHTVFFGTGNPAPDYDWGAARPGDNLYTAVDLSNPAAIGAGQELFNTTCAGYCHGRDGMQGKAPSLRARSDLSDERVHDTIANGRHNAGKMMPAWKGQLSDEKIWQITAFIHSLREPAP
jgi:alcohol dehydrogenase (cytochrome c)